MRRASTHMCKDQILMRWKNTVVAMHVGAPRTFMDIRQFSNASKGIRANVIRWKFHAIHPFIHPVFSLFIQMSKHGKFLIKLFIRKRIILAATRRIMVRTESPLHSVVYSTSNATVTKSRHVPFSSSALLQTRRLEQLDKNMTSSALKWSLSYTNCHTLITSTNYVMSILSLLTSVWHKKFHAFDRNICLVNIGQ